MIELNIIHVFLFLLLVLIQTIVGVGVLVLGTPILLILNYNIVETISIPYPSKPTLFLGLFDNNLTLLTSIALKI